MKRTERKKTRKKKRIDYGDSKLEKNVSLWELIE